jgi:hypothetical protein
MPTIEQLIQELGDNDFAVRQAADKAIEATGPEALPALRKALAAKPSLDVSRRLERLVSLLELRHLSDPKRITLDVADQPLQEAIDQIAKQSGYAIVLLPDKGREQKPCQFKRDRLTFWEALDMVCGTAGMIPSRTRDGVQLEFSDKHQPFVSRHGGFRVVAEGFHYSYSKNRSNLLNRVPRGPDENAKHVDQQISEYLQFSLMVEAEPRIPTVGIGRIAVSEAIDEQKRSLVAELPSGSGLSRFSRMDGSVQLQPQPRTQEGSPC